MRYLCVIGSRSFPSQERVTSWIGSAKASLDSDWTLVSGGAEGPDTWAEQEWMRLGGEVISFRTYETATPSWAIEVWVLGGSSPRVERLAYPPHPTFDDRESALFYRNTLMAEMAEGVVAFLDPMSRTRGAYWTAGYAEDIGKPVERILP